MFKTMSGNAVSVPQSFPQKRGKGEQEGLAMPELWWAVLSLPVQIRSFEKIQDSLKIT